MSSSSESLPLLLTIKQAADVLQVHPNTLRSWDKKNILVPIRIGTRGDRRYRRADIKRIISGLGSL